MYGNWFDYTREWETHIRTQTNIYPVYFEDLKMVSYETYWKWPDE